MTMTGFIDLQINGYAGLDFNGDCLHASDIQRVAEQLRADGVAKILVTIITAPIETMVRRIGAWANLIEQDASLRELVGGLHIEGPFISSQPGYVGAHDSAATRPASIEAAKPILDAGSGLIKMLTLAPEQDQSAKLTRWLVDQGIVVAAGHSGATLGQLRESIDAGLSLFTHLGNGCPGELPRHDNIIQRVLSLSERLLISFIADGHHVPFFALKNYLNRVPHENIVIVTDAIAAAGLGAGTYQLGHQQVEVDEMGAAWAADRTHFAGSATTMRTMANKLSDQLGASETDLQAWMVTNPGRALQSLNV